MMVQRDTLGEAKLQHKSMDMDAYRIICL